tara:strand:+ start:495 stop:659 length:165 start_codon:yes stop_codon:yes gene_type:complete
MDGISDDLNEKINCEVMEAKLRKKAKLIIEERRLITRAKIQELKELRQIEKDFK